jgi:hypothetical protein
MAGTAERRVWLNAKQVGYDLLGLRIPVRISSGYRQTGSQDAAVCLDPRHGGPNATLIVDDDSEPRSLSIITLMPIYACTVRFVICAR